MMGFKLEATEYVLLYQFSLIDEWMDDEYSSYKLFTQSELIIICLL